MLKLPQTTANNLVEFVEAPELGTMIKFLNILGHSVAIRLAGQSYIKDLPQPWSSFSTNESFDKEFGGSLPISDHILTTHPNIPKRLNEPHHLVAHDDVVHSISAFENSKGRGMGISNYMLIAEIMQINAYKQHLLDEDVNKIVEGYDANANEFADSVLLSQEDPDTRIDPVSDMERLEVMKIDDYVITAKEEEEEESAKAALIMKKGKSVMEIKDTPITTPTRSPKITLSSDKEQLLGIDGFSCTNF
ncbi:hypothetical protein Tco_1405667 [Tanacetum coccineum]